MISFCLLTSRPVNDDLAEYLSFITDSNQNESVHFRLQRVKRHKLIHLRMTMVQCTITILDYLANERPCQQQIYQ